MNNQEMIKLDLAHNWHPCSQMKDYETFPPIPIERANGSYLYTTEGKEIIDAISSWWCKSLGHCHPVIKEAVIKQLDKFEHIIGANTCNETIVNLSAQLAELIPGLDKVFYSENGSTAIEIAAKLSLQYNNQSGREHKKEFMSLVNGYHGESVLALSAGDCELYSKPYAHIMLKIPKIYSVPYVSGIKDENWDKISDEAWLEIENELAKYAENLSAIFFEPIVQGAGGMLIYSPDFLRRLRKWADKNQVHLIADEIMTGFGRTGKFFAFEYANIIPDFVAISKGLTGGYVPMSAVLCSTEVYNAFYDDYASGKAFLHSNTYTGYAAGAAAGLASLRIMQDEDIVAQVAKRGIGLQDRLAQVATSTNSLINLRGVGFVAAADIVNPATGKSYDSKLRTGYKCFQKAIELGAWLRPLGDTIYIFPPLNTDEQTLDKIAQIAEEALIITLKE